MIPRFKKYRGVIFILNVANPRDKFSELYNIYFICRLQKLELFGWIKELTSAWLDVTLKNLKTFCIYMDTLKKSGPCSKQTEETEREDRGEEEPK